MFECELEREEREREAAGVLWFCLFFLPAFIVPSWSCHSGGGTDCGKRGWEWGALMLLRCVVLDGYANGYKVEGLGGVAV